ncbi:MAG: hypothetical protein FWE31_01315 [Firmicutes bacterium]|nr:hypothetical protein [Bacillota bacterium]
MKKLKLFGVGIVLASVMIVMAACGTPPGTGGNNGPVLGDGLNAMNLSNVRPSNSDIVAINAAAGTVTFSMGAGGSVLIEQTHTAIQFDLVTQMINNGDFVVFSVDTGTAENVIVASAFVGVKMHQGNLYVAFASREVNFGLEAIGTWVQDSRVTVRRATSFNGLRMTFANNYETVSFRSSTMHGMAITGEHVTGAVNIRSLSVASTSLDSVQISNIRVA